MLSSHFFLQTRTLLTLHFQLLTQFHDIHSPHPLLTSQPLLLGPHGTCFHVARFVSTPSNWKVSLMFCGNRMCPPGRVSIYSHVQGPASQQTSFSGRDDEYVVHKLPFSGHIIKKFRGPSILQLNIKGLTASKMNVLHHLATQHEAFDILLQETHCISAEKLVLSSYQLAGFSLSRKHGLATFVHERLKRTL